MATPSSVERAPDLVPGGAGPFRRLLFRRTTQILLDGAAACAAFLAAYTIRFDGAAPAVYAEQAFMLAPAAALISVAIFKPAGVYRLVWRWLSVRDAGRILAATTAAAAAVAAADAARTAVFDAPRIPLGVLFVYPILFYFGALGLRVLRRATHAAARQRVSNKGGVRKRVVLAGAGHAGVVLAGEIRREDRFDWIGFVDDDPLLKGSMILGRRVLGRADRPADVLAEHQVDELILCMPDASLSHRLDIAGRWKRAGVGVSTVPALGDVAAGEVRLSRLRPVSMERLLSREVAALTPDAFTQAAYENATILVTGGAGSIGSEIVRQLIRLKPARILLLDKDENAVFETHLSLREAAVPSDPVVANVRDPERLRQVFGEWRPDCVFHAAAYKHVPLMEEFPQEAILNNVAGTNNVLEASVEFGVKTVVFISSDKAIRPANVMGASKRLGELLVQEYSARHRGVKMCAVRFGNVLGSRASVVPIFQNQIRESRTVTVTHPEVSRYLMTIPEAVGLVIQAGSVASGGDVFVLDMGDPVRIVDLARQLIELSGLRPGKDVRIEFSGLRRGEKLCEELFSEEESSIRSTRYSKVFAVNAAPPSALFMSTMYESLIAAAARNDLEAVESLLLNGEIGYKQKATSNDAVSAGGSVSVPDAEAIVGAGPPVLDPMPRTAKAL